jgi:hypothetical protein
MAPSPVQKDININNLFHAPVFSKEKQQPSSQHGSFVQFITRRLVTFTIIKNISYAATFLLIHRIHQAMRNTTTSPLPSLASNIFYYIIYEKGKKSLFQLAPSAAYRQLGLDNTEPAQDTSHTFTGHFPNPANFAQIE